MKKPINYYIQPFQYKTADPDKVKLKKEEKNPKIEKITYVATQPGYTTVMEKSKAKALKLMREGYTVTPDPNL
ncbi:MAG: hypothetical protein RL023_762 [Candidatus Parcubacteria bacterium]|jgi:hypothetical protein